MKLKWWVAGLFFAGIAATSAQETKPKEKEEVKNTANVTQSINNVINPKHKKHNGYKVKRKTKRGKKYVKKVNTRQNTAKIKSKNAGDVGKNVQVVSEKSK